MNGVRIAVSPIVPMCSMDCIPMNEFHSPVVKQNESFRSSAICSLLVCGSKEQSSLAACPRDTDRTAPIHAIYCGERLRASSSARQV